VNAIAALLPASNIVVDLDVATKPACFAAIGRLFEATTGLSATSVASSLSAREKLGSTGLGYGIAIPHGRMPKLDRARGAFVRLRAPIAFDAPDAKPVDQLFVLLVPEQATDQHLALLSELAQMFSERAFRERLAAARSAADIEAVFRGWQPQ
jgi:PTS system nitrogen regulatory IIA component